MVENITNVNTLENPFEGMEIITLPTYFYFENKMINYSEQEIAELLDQCRVSQFQRELILNLLRSIADHSPIHDNGAARPTQARIALKQPQIK